MIHRKISRIASARLHPGFLGEGHQAAAVIDGSDFNNTDPFILLMDDQLDLPGGLPVGGPHPHAGFETVTLVLEGNESDWKSGSLELMTAGKGIVHTEQITAQTRLRILQLWLVLPPGKRWAEPSWQQILLEDVPTIKTGESRIRVYSGSSNGLTSPLQNYTPFTLVDFEIEENSSASQQIPSSYRGFIYLLEGTIRVGERRIDQGQTAWLDNPEQAGNSNITFYTGEEKAHFVLYAGEPQRVAIVSHGPFIADTQEEIRALYQEYRQGAIQHLNDLPESRKIRHSKIAR